MVDRLANPQTLLTLNNSYSDKGVKMKSYLAIKTFIVTILVHLAINSGANAQACRTWVSGTGDDVNPCSRTAPCKTFAGAISKTAAGGEIDAQDPGGFGAVTITKSITIDCTDNLGGILITSGSAVTVAVGASDVVLLRNLDINGVNADSTQGILFSSGGTLILEDCRIYGVHNGIHLTAPGGKLIVRNSEITCDNNAFSTGVLVEPTNGIAAVSLSNVTIKDTTTAAVTANGGVVDVYSALITDNSGFGILGSSSAVINCIGNVLISNGTAFQANPGSTIRISNNDIYNNTTAFAAGGGIIATANNNRIKGNGSSPGSPNTSIDIR